MPDPAPESWLPYLLVQRESPTTYKILLCDVTHPLPSDAEVKALLNSASRCCSSMDLDQAYGFKAYKLINPIAGFYNRSVKDIRNQLVNLNDTFFEDKAIPCSPTTPFSIIKPVDGEMIIVFELRTAKRPRSPSPSAESNFKRVKDTKVAKTVPSTMAQPSQYGSIQRQSDQRILDDRPRTDEGIPPLPLLYHGFGHFLDIFHRSFHAGDPPGLDMSRLRRAVDGFASQMCKIYADEKGRQLEGLTHLNDIFSLYTVTQTPPLLVGEIGSVRTDGYNIGSHGAGVMFVEFKNELGCGQAIPEVQLLGYVAHSHANLRRKNEQSLLDCWRVPALGLAITGPVVQLFGFVFLKGRFRSVALTPGLSCRLPACDKSDRLALYQAFAAASVLQGHILRDAAHLINNLPPTIPDNSWYLPAISELPKYSSAGNFTLQIKRRYGGNHRQLYLAKVVDSGDQPIIVKFTPSYCLELHEYCAQRGYAPNIIAAQFLPGGWWAIAMEYLESADSIAFSDTPALTAEFGVQLQTLVRGFHNEGFVHGDLRDANILLDKKTGKPVLVDFDWGGKDGEVCYPTPNLNGELLAGRTPGDWKIRKEDDLRVLANTLAKFGLSLRN